MADASDLLGSPEITGAWVNPRGTGKRTMDAVAFGQYGTGEGPGVETPSFGAFGYLAVSASDLVVVKGKRGLVGLKMGDEVVAKVSRNDVASIDLGEGKVTYPLTINFTSGGQWELEVARAHRGAAERLIAEVAAR